MNYINKMKWFERVQYFILFLLNKYLDLSITDKWLNSFEDRMIKKYLPREYVEHNEIPTIEADELTDKKFRELSNNYRNPVLIKGYNKDSDAVKKWNIDYLCDIIGNFEVNTVKYGDKFMLEKIPFNEFVNRMDENLYINNNHTIFAKYPKLFNDISHHFTKFINTLMSTNLKNIHIANLFIGYNSPNKLCSGSNMHCGGSGNFFCMITGKKHWTLINPKYSCLLKGRVAKSGIHGQTLFEMIDKKDLSIYPEIYKYLPRYEVTLEPGDILWNAPWWWHRIRNDNGLSVGLAIRNNKVTKLNFINNPTFTLAGSIYLKYNTYIISIYEKLVGKDKNFCASSEENKKDNVLYQIEMLNSKYPNSYKLSDILE